MTQEEWTPNKLAEHQEENKQCFDITHKRPFNPAGIIPNDILTKTIDFAFSKAFTTKEQHRAHRSGGQEERKPGQIFINAFQGKLAEFALADSLTKNGVKCPKPNLEVWQSGNWDTADMVINDKSLCVKSTKYYGNLILLETKDWNTKGQYIPNIGTNHENYDAFILVRLKPDGEQIMKRNRLLYAVQVQKRQLEDLIKREEWQYDVPGFVSRSQLTQIISDKYILPQNCYLNGATKMDAENYYIQSGDLMDMEDIKDLL